MCTLNLFKSQKSLILKTHEIRNTCWFQVSDPNLSFCIYDNIYPNNQNEIYLYYLKNMQRQISVNMYLALVLWCLTKFRIENPLTDVFFSACRLGQLQVTHQALGAHWSRLMNCPLPYGRASVSPWTTCFVER